MNFDKNKINEIIENFVSTKVLDKGITTNTITAYKKDLNLFTNWCLNNGTHHEKRTYGEALDCYAEDVPTVLAYLRWSTLCLLNGGAHVEPLDGTAIGLWRSCSWDWIRMILRI